MMAKRKSFQEYASLGSISAKLVFNNFPFVLFLGFLATIYIANAHYAESKVRHIRDLQAEVKDLKREYNSLQAEIMHNARFSEVERAVTDLGLHSNRREPKRIIVND